MHVDSQDTEPAEGEAPELNGEASGQCGGAAPPTQTEATTQQSRGDPARTKPDTFSMGSDMPGTETEDEAFGLDRRRRSAMARGSETRWTTLVGITESQARPLVTESLEADIQQLGDATQGLPPTTSGGEDSDLLPTLPWTTEGHPQGGDVHHDGDTNVVGDFYQPDGGSESSDQSHRRRRLHAAGFN